MISYSQTLEQFKKMPQEHFTDYKGRRMQVKDVVSYLEDEQKRLDALLKRVEDDKKLINIK